MRGEERSSAVRNRPRPRERLSLIDWSVKKTRRALLNRKLFRAREPALSENGYEELIESARVTC